MFAGNPRGWASSAGKPEQDAAFRDVCGAAGKWGLGPMDSTGSPLKQGFDVFFGYNCQGHAHNYYPSWLWKNNEKIKLPGNTDGDTGETYSADLVEAIPALWSARDAINLTALGVGLFSVAGIALLRRLAPYVTG